MSASSSSSSSSSQRDAIVKMAKKLVQLPYIYDTKNTKTIEALAHEVHNALEQSRGAFGEPQQRLKGREAVQASACAVAALQCAGWLVESTSCFRFTRHELEAMSADEYQAADANLHLSGQILGLVSHCSETATVWLACLDMDQVGLGLLRRVTSPPDDAHVPGEAAVVTTAMRCTATGCHVKLAAVWRL